MPKLVVHGAVLQCNQGTSPATLTVLPDGPASGDERPAATVMDNKPMANIAPFGMCRAPANPQVAAATAAAQGVLTPQPCVPVIAAPWSPGAAVVKLDDIPALTDGSTCMCQWAGSIGIVEPGTDLEIE